MNDIPLARGIAEAVRSGRSSAVEVVDAFLERAAEGRHLNALVATRDAAARDEARAVDRAVAAGQDPGLLAGVPFTVKDVLATEDLPTTSGSRVLAGYRTPHDAIVVQRLRAAGAILIGKTNAPEFAFGVHTVNRAHGVTRNPLGDVTVGGSSGGEAAAIAAGMSAFGVGTDFGGSLRWPAECTGIVGLRPTVGAVPNTGLVPELPGASRSLQAAVQVIGPLARTVDDAELVFDVLRGHPAAGGPGADERAGAGRGVEATSIADMEVLVGTDVGGFPVVPEVGRAVAWTAGRLREAGAAVVDGLPDVVHEAPALYSLLRQADSHDAIRDLVGDRLDELTPYVRDLLVRPAATAEAADLVAAWAGHRRAMSDLDAVLEERRLLLLPVSTVVPFPVDERPNDDFDVLVPSRAISLFGVPAISIPVGRTVDGRPVSVQLVGPRGREDLLFSAARIIESVVRRKGKVVC